MHLSTEPFSARLDKLPLNAFHVRVSAALGFVLFLAGLGLTFDGLVGSALGAVAAVGLGGRLGRKHLLSLGLVLVAVGGVRTALAPSAAGLAGQLVAGAGVGLAFVAATMLVADLAPRRSRAVLVAVAAVDLVIGVLAAAAVSGPAVSLGIAGVTLLSLAVVRLQPESPWYLASRGRVNEADAVARRVERAGGAPLITVARASAPPAPRKTGTDRILAIWVVGAALGVALGWAAALGPLVGATVLGLTAVATAVARDRP